MPTILKKLIKEILYYFFPIQTKGKNNRVNVLASKYRSGLRIFIYGNNNKVYISDKCVFNGVIISIWDNNCEVVIDEEVKIQKGRVDLYDGAKLIIEHNSTFQEVSISLKEQECHIGEDCMFSYGIIIRNHDGHKIIDLGNNHIINPSGTIFIDKHVWVGQDVTILKHSRINQGAIIGQKALVAGCIEENCIAVGIPAKKIKQNVSWIRH